MKIKKLRNRLIWTLSGIIIGIGITLSLNYTQASSFERFKTEEQRIEMITRHEEGLTLKQIYEQVKKNTEDIKKLKKEK